VQAERYMIGQLKDKCGFEYTAKLQRMFNDVRLSNDINKAFSLSLGQSLRLGFNVLVLQTGAWPLAASTSTSLTLSSQLASTVEKFSLFYNVGWGCWHGPFVRSLALGAATTHWASTDMALLPLKRRPQG
jgi:hypothetical protein